MVRSEGHMSLKTPETPPEIDTGTVRLVAQRLNHYATPDPTESIYLYITQKVAVVEFLLYCDCGTPRVSVQQ